MLRTNPAFSYCGLTIVLSHPSRFDKTRLLSATGGGLVNDCLRPEFNVGQCDIRVKEDTSKLLEGTKCILLLGHHSWLPQYKENTLGEIRGLLSYTIDGIPIIASFFPQDAIDIVNYEKDNNEFYESDDTEEESSEELGTSDKRRHGRTKRSNYRFWITKDVDKIKNILLGRPIPSRPFQPNYIIYPRAELVIKVFRETKNQFLYFDMETDYELNMLCFSFSFSGSNDIYVIPCLNHLYTWAYADLHHILQALVWAINHNTLVAHNGSGFDFFVLVHKYKLLLSSKLYDTMLAQHRCFPEVEKSLGHTISLWAYYEEYHKDEGGSYNSLAQCNQMWSYCGKDVFTMRLCHIAIEEYASKRPGLKASINQAMESIRPYLLTTLHGIEYDENIRSEIMTENDRLMTHYLRCITLLIGEDSMKKIRGNGKEGMPGSNPQCVRYFHEMLQYPVVGKTKERKDGTRGPSLAKQNMFKLRLRFNNPVIDFCIAYRETQKESGSLKFTPWKL